MPARAQWLASGILLFLVLPAAAACRGGEPTAPGDEPPHVRSKAVAWLDSTVHPFRTDEPEGDDSDLAFLEDVVGDARVVGLGEATHGTAEFFRMKDRVLRYLVREMGFDAFAIEATWLELERIDRYVRTGDGDPEVLLSGQYFWTWNTREVLEMIEWVRSWNETHPADPVRFLGFDMQYAGMPVHMLESYLAATDPEAADVAEERLACLRPFLNGPAGQEPSEYHEEDAAYRGACRQDLDALLAYVLDRRDALVTASSEASYELALQALRTVLQFEDQRSERFPMARDVHMAQNTLWQLDRLGPDARMVVWAHNSHVGYDSRRQGDVLRDSLGPDYVNLGFAFHEGTANAVGFDPPGPPKARTMPEPPISSYEAYFEASKHDRFVLDLRGLDFDDPATSWLEGPRAFREIGAGLSGSRPQAHARPMELPERFDAIVFFEGTTASELLRFRPPDAF